jgi:hypothetical protein
VPVPQQGSDFGAPGLAGPYQGTPPGRGRVQSGGGPAVRPARSAARPATSPATADVVAVVRKSATQAVMFSAAVAIASESRGARPR